MQIGKLNLQSEKTNLNKSSQTNSRINQFSTNPFGVSFKGNVIQADVFEKNKNISENISEKGKLFASAVVSGINNFNESFKSRMNSIVSFGKKITNNIFDKIEQIGNTEISFDLTSFKNRLFPNQQYSAKNLSNKSVDDLRLMWEDLEAEEV